MHLRPTLLTATLLPSLVFLMGADGGCGPPPIIENNGFDLWCGEELCHWEVEDGAVERIATWHKSDHGIELRGNVASISQLATISGRTECLRIRAVANVEETATVTVEIDFFDDGTVDYSERVPTSDWAPISFLATPPRAYRGARFRIKKVGSGQAQLAELVVDHADKCVDPPAEIADRPPGAVCASHDECITGLCGGLELGLGRCAECSSDVSCTGDRICGLAQPASAPLELYRGCQDPASDALGERCVEDRECESSICAGSSWLSPYGACSSCRSGEDCASGECEELRIEGEDVDLPPDGPRMCAPYSGLYASGEPCLLDESCASGACEGPSELRVCADDGRLCDDASDCFRSEHCVAMGTFGGTCR